MKHGTQAALDVFLARIERQISEQNATLRDAIDGDPALTAKFARALAFQPIKRRAAPPRSFAAMRA